MSLLEYFFPKFPPLAKDPIPNIRIIKTTRQVIIVIMNRIEDIFFFFLKLILSYQILKNQSSVLVGKSLVIIWAILVWIVILYLAFGFLEFKTLISIFVTSSGCNS